jgi:hypothetical protein
MNRCFPILALLALLAWPAAGQKISEIPETNYLADVDNLYWLSKVGPGYASRRMPWGTLRSNVNTGLRLTNFAATVEGRGAQMLRFYGGERLTLLSLDQTDDSGTGIWFSDDGEPYWQIRAETGSMPLDFLSASSNAVFGLTQDSNVIVYAGSIGIGTNSPQAKLHIVDGSANSSPGMRLQNDVQKWETLVNGAGNDEWILYDVNNAKAPIRVYPNQNNGLLTVTNNCVGINYPSPNQQLCIGGSLYVSGNSVATFFYGSGLVDPAQTTSRVIVGHNTGIGMFTGSGTVQRVIIDTNGLVGIGITTPTSKLHIAGDLAIAGTYTATGTTGNTGITNQVAGSVNFAALAQTLYVTNAHATNGVLAFATVNTADTTALSCAAIPASPAAGVLALKLNAAATAETRVSFLIIKP